MIAFYLTYLTIALLVSIFADFTGDDEVAKPLTISSSPTVRTNDPLAISTQPPRLLSDPLAISTQPRLLSLSDLPSSAPSLSTILPAQNTQHSPTEEQQEEEQVDLEFYQPDLHFQHTFPSRELLQRKNSQSSWHSRRSFYVESFHLAHQVSRDGGGHVDLTDEDVLSYQAFDIDWTDEWKRQFKLTLMYLVPLYTQYPTLSIPQRIWAIIQTPVILVFSVLSPLMEPIYLIIQTQIEKSAYSPVIATNIPESIVMEDQESCSCSEEYPVILLCIQVFFACLVSFWMMGGTLFFPCDNPKHD